MSRLTRAAGVRAGEGRILALVALLFGALEAGRGFGEVGIDTLVVSRFGTGTLPYLYIGLGATSLVVTLAYGAALGRVSRTPLLAGILLGGAGLLVAGRLVMAAGVDGIVPVIWLVTYAAGAIAGTISWTVAGSVFDARQAKRLFPLCTGAAIAGSFVGTLASGPVAHAAGTELLMVIEAVLLAAVAGLLVAVARTGRLRTPARRQGGPLTADLRAGFDDVVRSPLFRLVAVAYVLFSVMFFCVTFPFLQAASTAFPNEADLATALGLLSAAVTATSFVISLVVANRVYARFGVATAALVLPIVYVAGFALWLVQFSFATAAIVRFTQQVTQRGLSNAIWSAFYNVVPSARRAQVLAFMDGVPGQLGIMLSGPEAGGVLRRCLRSTDPEIRAQALEALDSIGDRKLRGAVVRLLDADTAGRGSDRGAVLRRLMDDGDPWIGALARRTLADEGGTTAMPETGRTMSEIDTMLTLRRVPLFEGLDPEDLQRIAATCLERVYAAGEALVREGELGDELIVIFEGSVRVVQAGPDGGERLIRRYGSGDHIGELAILRERPRIATVIAEGDGVRAQVINGESLKAILRERPEAAMAMLATLAERISAQ